MDSTRQCEYCGLNARHAGRFCTGCGRELAPPPAAATAASLPGTACSPEPGAVPWQEISEPAAQPARNPFLTIWYRPRGTIRAIVDTDPRRYVLLLAAVGGISEALETASSRDIGDTLGLPTILLLVVILGPIGGIVGVYLMGWILSWTGSLLGGIASTEEVRAALAWSQIPQILVAVLSLPLFMILGSEAFTAATPRVEARMESSLALALIVFLLSVGVLVVSTVVTIWNLIIYCKCLGEVHRFSAWRGLGTLLVPALAVVTAVLLWGILLG